MNSSLTDSSVAHEILKRTHTEQSVSCGRLKIEENKRRKMYIKKEN